MPVIHQRAAARRDWVEHFVYRADNAGLEVADRFLAHAEISFDAVADQPLMGLPLTLHLPELAALRKWHVKDSDSFLIFYQPRPDGVSNVRVLHGSRDGWGLLGCRRREVAGRS